MSNIEAVATVTATISQIVRQSVNSVQQTSGPIEIRTGRPPSDTPPWVGVNIYLFRTTPNPFRRNDDLATRTSDGVLIRRPQAAIDLEYLVSFYGNDAKLEPHRLLAATVVGLHSEAILTPERIRETIAAAGPSSPIWGSDLDQQLDHVRLNPIHLDLETLSRMWSVFQTPFALTISVVASPVLLDADLPVRRALPVSQVAGGVSPSGVLSIDDITPAIASYSSASSITITSNATGGPIDAVFDAATIETTRVDHGFLATLPSTVLPGVNTLRLRRTDASGVSLGDSAPAEFIVQPATPESAFYAVVPDPRSPSQPPASIATIAVPMLPSPVGEQQATLALNPVSGSSATASYALTTPLRRYVDPSIIPDLDRGVVSNNVRSAFRSEGIALSHASRCTVNDAGRSWTIVDHDARYRLLYAGGVLCVAYGMPSSASDATIAFLARDVAPGTYLFAVGVDDDSRTMSPLLRGVALGSAVLRSNPPPTTDEIRSFAQRTLAKNKQQLPSAASVTPATAGDAWSIAATQTSPAYYLRRVGTHLQMFQLTDDGAYIGPIVTVSPPSQGEDA